MSPLEHNYDFTKDDKSIEELLARKRLPRSPYERDMTDGPAAGPSAFRAVGVEHNDAAKRIEEFERKKAELRGFVLQLAKIKVEEK